MVIAYKIVMDKIHIKQMILADDLTGANDTGVHFLPNSSRVMVIVDAQVDTFPELAETTVINTDTRFLSPKDAYKKIHDIMGIFISYQPNHIYKKIDSTLRGNIGSEIDALMDVTNYSLTCVASASPRNGRTVRDGLCYVHGELITDTEIAHDPFNPVTSSSILEVLTTQTTRKIGLLLLSEIRSPLSEGYAKLESLVTGGAEIIVTDAESAEDLRKVKQLFAMLSDPVLFVGSAGLFHAVNNNSDQFTYKKPTPLFCIKDYPNILFVIGSLMDTTLQQVEYLCHQQDVANYKITTEELLKADNDLAIGSSAKEIAKGFRKSSIVLMKTDRMQVDKPATAIQIGNALGSLVYAVMKLVEIDVLVVTGGDTAKNVLKKIQVNSFELIDEVLPGVPMARIRRHTDDKMVLFVTKAGSYGDLDALFRVVEYMEEESNQSNKEEGV